jgi:hypothetical protein
MVREYRVLSALGRRPRISESMHRLDGSGRPVRRVE